MSEISPSVVATEAPSTEAAPATETAAPLKGRAALRARLTAANDAAQKVFAAAKPAVTVPGETTNTETVAETVADLKQAGVEVPDQKPTETKGQYETKIAKLLLQVQRAESEGLKHKGALDKANAELTDLKAKFAEASSDPVKALKLAGMTPDELAQAMLDGKLTKAEEQVAKQELSPELLEVIAEHKKLKAEKEAQIEAAEAAKLRESNIKIIETAKAGVAEQFPVLELIPNDRLLDAYQQIAKATGEEPDFAEFAAQMQKNIVAEVSAAVSHKGTLKALLAEKPELRDFLITELGLKPAAVAPAVEAVATSPRTLTNASAAENPAKGRPLTARERQAMAAAEAEKMFRSLKGG